MQQIEKNNNDRGARPFQLNRITGMNAYNGMDLTTNTFTPVALDDYKERITYDPNGNILNYLRNGSTLPVVRRCATN